MDFSKIFLKEACPTSVGGQAIIEGIMMKGKKSTAVAVRMPDGAIHLKTEKLKESSGVSKIPILRGIVAFGAALVYGTKILMQGAEMLEDYENEHAEELAKLRKEAKEKGTSMYGDSEAYDYSKGKMELWIEEKFGEKAAWNIMIYTSVIIALFFTIAVFIVAPTAIVNFCQAFTTNDIVLNLIEGVFRIAMFVLYIWAIAKMREIGRVFQFHGAEHKTIHCFENNLELTPENSQTFYTLHPRCGTSFLMFVMVISLILFSLLGWPNLLYRIGSRIVLIPLIAGISYEVLKWAGKSDSFIVKIISMPGLYLQKLTTKEPEKEHLEVAIVAMKAVLDEEREENLDICLSGYGEFMEKVFNEKYVPNKKEIDEVFENIEEDSADELEIEISEEAELMEIEKETCESSGDVDLELMEKIEEVEVIEEEKGELTEEGKEALPENENTEPVTEPIKVVNMRENLKEIYKKDGLDGRTCNIFEKACKKMK